MKKEKRNTHTKVNAKLQPYNKGGNKPPAVPVKKYSLHHKLTKKILSFMSKHTAKEKTVAFSHLARGQAWSSPKSDVFVSTVVTLTFSPHPNSVRGNFNVVLKVPMGDRIGPSTFDTLPLTMLLTVFM